MHQFNLSSGTWKQKSPSHDISMQSVTDLFENAIPAIIVANFLSKAQCDNLVEDLNKSGMSRYTHVSSKVLKFGAVQAECNSPEKKQHYFGLARSFEPRIRALYKDIPLAPVDFLKKELSRIFCTRACVAKEEAFGDYFAGTFRNIQGPGFLHFDFARHEAPGWEISNVSAQLSWNLYLNDNFEGGELQIYEKQWQLECEEHKVPGCYSYAKTALGPGKSFIYKPKKGDLVLFNSRNFHEIAAPSAPRLTQSSFIGAQEDGSFWFWS